MKAVADRPLGLRHQVGMAAVRVRRANSFGFVVHEPISAKSHELREDEYFLLTQLQPDVSLTDLKRRFEQRFLDRTVSVVQLQSLLYRFHGLGLTVHDSLDQASSLLRRGDRERRATLAGGLAQWMFLRLPGIDPAPLMRWLMPICKPFLGWIGLVVGLTLVIAAMIALLVHHDRFIAQLPLLDHYLNLQNAMVLAIVLATMKVIHELGHAIVSERFGAPCRSIGVMLLVFTPALYCDVSASWMIANRWKRIAIAMAGMAAEMICASIAIFVWLQTPPGLVHVIASHVVIVCGISTVVVNANPLLRYDGYYILSDLVGVPNLSQRAQARWKRFVRRWVFGIQAPVAETEAVDRSFWLLVYAIASAAYRWMLMVTVVWFVWTMLRPVGLDIIGQAMAMFVFAGFLVTLFQPVQQWWNDPGQGGRMTMRRRIGLMLVVTMAAAVLLIPFPSHVIATGRIIPVNESRVFVQTPGSLTKLFVKPGQWVSKGEILAQLNNVDIAIATVEAKGKVAIQEERLGSLQRSKHAVPESFEYIQSATALLNQRRDELASTLERAEALTVHSPRDGIVLPPASVNDDQQASLNDRDWIDPDANRDPTSPSDSVTLTRASGRPTDRSNQGCWLEAGTELLSVASLDRWIVEASVEAVQAERLQLGSKVSIWIGASDPQVLAGTITGMSHDRSAATSTDGSRRDAPIGQQRTQTPLAKYLVIVELTREDQSPIGKGGLVGGTVFLKMDAAKISLAGRLWEQLAGLFRFR